MSETSSHHIAPLKEYLSIFTALLVLTGVTVFVAYLDLGFLNTAVAITIAVIKALLVVLFFMHLKYSPKIIWITAGAGFLWILIMFCFTLADVWTRPIENYFTGWF